MHSRTILALLAAITVAACSDRSPTDPTSRLSASAASHTAGPNDVPLGASWSCKGSPAATIACLKAISADPTPGAVVAAEIIMIQASSANLGQYATASCTATGTQFYVDAVSKKVTNGQPTAGCVIDTDPSIQHGIVYWFQPPDTTKHGEKP